MGGFGGAELAAQRFTGVAASGPQWIPRVCGFLGPRPPKDRPKLPKLPKLPKKP